MLRYAFFLFFSNLIYFFHQEPGDADKICAFVEKKNVKFDMFEKIDVNGKNAHPLYEYLKMKQPDDKGRYRKNKLS